MLHDVAAHFRARPSRNSQEPAERRAHLIVMARDSATARPLWCRKELGHVILHGSDNADAAVHRGLAEVEAESVALMIGSAHGLDTSSYTVPYVTSWASSVPGKSPVEVVQSTAERVRHTAVAILDRLDTRQVGDGDPPGLDRETPSAKREPPGVATAPRSEPAGVGL